MNFFERQEAARRNSRVLMVLFFAAVAATAIAVDLLVSMSLVGANLWAGNRLGGAHTLSGQLAHVPLKLHVLVIGLVLLLTLGVSFAKTLELRAGGGAAVARMLGGRFVGRANATDPLERRLLNVVEEMAIAAATRVPEVYVLDSQKGINAFAAGDQVSRCAIVVTRGALETLTRDELQGVVGHEFSHIVNGDMALNIRMIGLLAGIVWIGALGDFIMRAAARTREKGAAAAMSFGFALWAIGSTGLLFSRFIKALVSREREYLADASGVQFTRHAEGLAGALDQIRVHYSWVAHPRSESVSHLFIADAHGALDEPLFATHPAIEKRIARLVPRFDAEGYRKRRVTAVTEALSEAAAPAAMASESRWRLSPAEAVALVGTIEDAQLEQARASLGAIPPELRGMLDDGRAAAGVVVALLACREEPPRAEAMPAIERAGFAALAQDARAAIPFVCAIPVDEHLALLDLSLPALLSRPEEERLALVRALESMLAAEPRVSIYGFALATFVRSQLAAKPAPRDTRYRTITQLRDDAAVLISLVAHAGCASAATLEQDFVRAFQAGCIESGLVGQVGAVRREDCTPDAASGALQRLQALAPLEKARLVKALFAAITADGVIRPVEAALMRMIGGVLDCPLPRLAIAATADAPAAEPAAASA